MNIIARSAALRWAGQVNLLVRKTQGAVHHARDTKARKHHAKTISKPCQGGGDRRRRCWLFDPVSSGQVWLERRGSAGTGRADIYLQTKVFLIDLMRTYSQEALQFLPMIHYYFQNLEELIPLKLLLQFLILVLERHKDSH